jgi:hypothetical protein
MGVLARFAFIKVGSKDCHGKGLSGRRGSRSFEGEALLETLLKLIEDDRKDDY